MTEKRFSVVCCVTDWYIEDKEINPFAVLTPHQASDLLNEQHKQIQELIQSSKELEEDCQSTFNAMSRKQDDLYRKNFKLKEENEQLKKELDQFYLLIGRGDWSGLVDLIKGDVE